MHELREFQKDSIYHVYNRGNRKKNIFYDIEDYYFYRQKMADYCKECTFELICYCLMPNHLHICLQQKGDVGLDKFMQKLHTSYSKYLNNKYFLMGHTFQNRFKHKLVTTDEYLKYLSAYIHNNPKDLDYVDILTYPFSSAREFSKGFVGIKLCKSKELIQHFKDNEDYVRYLRSFKEVSEDLFQDKQVIDNWIAEKD